MNRTKHVSEDRTEHLLRELLQAQGWDLRRPPSGDVLLKQEYKSYPVLQEILKTASKSGEGAGLPEALLVDRSSVEPLAIIEAKANIADLGKAIKEATEDYAMPCIEAGYNPLAIGIAGTTEDEFDIRVLKWSKTKWVNVTYEGKPINWIPNQADLQNIASPSGPSELRPTVPPPDVLARRADEINRLLRESGIMDQIRPGIVGAIMLALWYSKGKIRRDEDNILADINNACRNAFIKAKKPELAASLRVDEANDTLAIKARRVLNILERLNVTMLTAEHDYLGQLYETFFRYTGGNTIGQYFTPRHITQFVSDLVEVGRNDIVLDPACGTGGFLIAAMNRIGATTGMSRTAMVKLVRKNLLGFDKEPMTAALCVANMILRGDGSTGVKRADCFSNSKFPREKATVILMNPPFPHEKTDTPTAKFIDRALEGLRQHGRLAVIVPMNLLVERASESWRSKLLSNNTLNGIISLPDELFQPYASSTTNILLITKGVPHNFKRAVFFGRIENDGFTLRKGVRIPRSGGQLQDVLQAYQQSKTILGVCGWADITSKSEWRPGAYIPSRTLTPAEILDEVSILVRSKTAVIVKYAPQFQMLKNVLKKGELIPHDFHEYIGTRRQSPSVTGNVIGKYFEIYYGQNELENKDGLGYGVTPVISSSGEDNGLFGFYAYDWLILPPFVTVPRTGSIGHAHVQEFPCGASSDNLLLLPKKDTQLEMLYVAAAIIRREKWRFNHGAKMTPQRIANFPLQASEGTLLAINRQLKQAAKIEDIAMKV